MQGNRDTPLIQNEMTDPFLAETVELLSFRALHDDDPMTRKHSVYLLGQERDPGSIDTCIQAISDPEKAVRAQAARALAAIGEPAAGRLITLLNDPDWKVRYRAAEALGTMKSRTSVPYLIKRLSDEKDHVRYMAAKSLGLIGDPLALSPLTDAQDDENPYVRKIVNNSLQIIQGSQS